MARTSHTESDLRQTTIDEHFASCHKAAVIGGEEQGHSSRFVRVAYAFKWCLTGKAGKKSFLHSRLRQSIEKTWRRCSPGESTLTRMPVPFRSSAQLRAKLRIAALVELYTLKAGVPMEPVVDPVRMME